MPGTLEVRGSLGIQEPPGALPTGALQGPAEAPVLSGGPRATHFSTAPNTSPFMAARCFGWPGQMDASFDCAPNKPPADQ